MNSKLHINASLGLIEVEGDASVVLKIYDDLRDLLRERFGNAACIPPDANESLAAASETANAASAAKRPRTVSKRNGPSCGERILNLQSAFFKTPQSNGEIGEGLKEKGHTYQSNQIAAALTSLTKAGKLRRTKTDGIWKYTNP